jgi:hypothetical protein
MVTAHMAQQVIQRALLNQNLAPQIQSKLLAFQKKQQQMASMPKVRTGAYGNWQGVALSKVSSGSALPDSLRPAGGPP